MSVIEPDPAKLFGVRRGGGGTALYKRVIRHDPCAYCGEPAPIGEYGGNEIDHIKTKVRGGPLPAGSATYSSPT